MHKNILRLRWWVSLLDRRAWIFDLDGTLTIAQHDFDAIRRDLGLPPGRPILEALAELDVEQATVLHQRLGALELELARQAQAAQGARQLLERLAGHGAPRGILTRNSRPNAHAALSSTGLSEFFEAETVLGRDEAPPKPSPEGILKLCRHWGIDPRDAVMIGDFEFDLRAGRNAGTMTIHVDLQSQFQWPELADVQVASLVDLHELVCR